MNRKYLPTVTYLLICFIISVPFNYGTFQLLYTRDGIPAGSDNAFHTYSVLKILDTNNPLISYSAFPTLITNNSNYYPSFFHLTVASVTRIAGLNQQFIHEPEFVIEVEKGIMYAVSLAGTAGYALVIRSILGKSITSKIGANQSMLFFTTSRYLITYLIISVLAFGIFIFSVSPILKTFNDGTYPQIFAMWLIFPYYLYLLINRHWISSAVLLSIIASTHNLSIFMSLSATIPYLSSLILFQRDRELRNNLIKFSVVFVILAIPALILFYIPTVRSVLFANEPGETMGSWSIKMVINQLKPGLYYAGIIAAPLLVLLNYRILGWISGWVFLYFMAFTLSYVIGARFARELSVVFGIAIGIAIAYILLMSILSGRKWFSFSALELRAPTISSFKLILVVIISTSLIPLWYLYFLDRFLAESNPLAVKYLTEAIDKANRFFLTSVQQDNKSSSSSDNNVIALFGPNPWLRVTTYGKFDVLHVQSPDSESILGGRDKRLNADLQEILMSPNTERTACILERYGVDYVYITDEIPGRFYTTYQKDKYFNQLNLFQSVAHTPYLELKEEFVGDDLEHIRIFSVNNENVGEACRL